LQNMEEHIADLSGCHYRFETFNCKAINSIYLISCSLCNILYVGQTKNTLKCRMQQHISNIRNNKPTSIARHFNLPGHSIRVNFKVAILHSNIKTQGLNISEATWIGTLDTIPRGLNCRDEARLKLEYQTMCSIKHFKHSKTCMPYIIPRIKSITTCDLKFFKRPSWVRTRRDTRDQRTSRQGTTYDTERQTWPALPRMHCKQQQ
jgi:hypothetical protein